LSSDSATGTPLTLVSTASVLGRSLRPAFAKVTVNPNSLLGHTAVGKSTSSCRSPPPPSTTSKLLASVVMLLSGKVATTSNRPAACPVRSKVTKVHDGSSTCTCVATIGAPLLAGVAPPAGAPLGWSAKVIPSVNLAPLISVVTVPALPPWLVLTERIPN
jgi:hypothetical protein